MDINLAKQILQIENNHATDITFNVKNELERDNIREKVYRLDNNIKVIEKAEIKKNYENIFNYKGGFF